MISSKSFNCDGNTTRFLSDFIIRSEEFCRPYVFIVDTSLPSDGTGDVLQDTNEPWHYPTNLYRRGSLAPLSEDGIPTDKWDVVDNSILFYTPPPTGTTLWLEVATTTEEFGDSLVAPSVEKAKEYALEAKTSAEAAAVSETNAKTSETNSKTSEVNAKASEDTAKISETNAKTSETNAKTSETNAAASAAEAKTSETNAKTSETNAAASAAAAASSESTVTDSAAAAKASEIASKQSENNAKASETSATNSKNSAAASASTATNAANAASISEGNAKASEDVAKISETNANSAANSALSYKDDANASKIAAEASKAAAAASEDKAYKWADNPEDTPVIGSEYSAYHWAKKSEEFAGIIDPNAYVKKSGDVMTGSLTIEDSNVLLRRNGKGKLTFNTAQGGGTSYIGSYSDSGAWLGQKIAFMDDGRVSFPTNVPEANVDPQVGNHLTRKSYVDNKVASAKLPNPTFPQDEGKAWVAHQTGNKWDEILGLPDETSKKGYSITSPSGTKKDSVWSPVSTNPNILDEDWTIADGVSALVADGFTINDNITLTVPDGSVLVVV